MLPVNRDVNTGYLDTRVPCGLPGSREISNLPSYRDRLHQSTDCPCGHIQASTALAAAENAERPVFNSLLIIIAHAAR